MKCAENLDDVLQAFVLEPLKEETMVYYRDAITVRMDSPVASPIDDIY